MRHGLIVMLIMSGFLAACGAEEEARTVANETSGTPSGEPSVETVEVTREVTVERTVTPNRQESIEEVTGGATRERLPGPALPSETDIRRMVGETATLDNGNRVTVISGESGVPADESVYNARAGMDFFVIEAEVCTAESAAEPSYFTPREFGLLNDNYVRRLASVPTKLPALRGSSVEPGECNRGYITFQVEDGKEPRTVVYDGSSVVEWELEEG
ncbi:MAG: DUF4352 domain-containing protein [Actinomycetota bacterium]|nr:DUF4352 domain-containing protein [Actinomycetota bacterium]HZY65447.1 hypothetical protein [Rubrobacteraceae bacterium]